MEFTDEQLQSAIEAGHTDSDSDDGRAYRQVFAALQKAPKSAASMGFEDAIMQKIVAQQTRQASREYLWYALGIVLLVIAMVVTVVLTDFRIQLDFLRGMSTYAGVFIFGTVFIVFLHILDRRLLHNRRA